ncbi:MAG: ATP-dependent DNA helicase, partial [Phycisphaerae bacterium]|nr:ATP-dependent DNA helicase [Phycisphaerae bacterium]
MRVLSREILGPGGAVSRALRAAGVEAESRPEQAAMAGAVERCLAGRGRLLVEAGTGVGKSFAYLVPAMLRCVSSGERVVVATHTIALQEQLVKKDVPLLSGTIGEWGLDPSGLRALSAVLVKGRGNYVSIRRLKLASEREGRLFPDAASRASLRVIEEWAYGTEDGSLATLPPVERPSVWDRVQSDADNCMGRKCPHFEACFYQRSRRAMEGANLLICNHAVFFADLSMRASGLPGFLPEYQHVVLDEAHCAEEVASEHFGLGLTEGRVEHLLGVLHHARTGKGYLGHLGTMPGLAEAADEAAHAALRALDASRGFFDGLVTAARRGESAVLRSGRVVRPGIVENVLTPAMKHLSARLRLLREKVKNEPDRLELNAYAVRADAIAFDADALVEQAREGYVYWLETGEQEGGDGGMSEQAKRTGFPRGFRGRTRVKLACSPIDVAPVLREHLWGQEVSVVLTSATLAVRGAKGAGVRGGGDEDEGVAAADDAEVEGAAPCGVDPAFAHIAGKLGCDRAETLLFGSPFVFERQVEVRVDVGGPDPRG